MTDPMRCSSASTSGFPICFSSKILEETRGHTPGIRASISGMGQVTIYLDDETDSLLKSAVKSTGISKSKWIAEAIRKRARGEWPREVIDLAGAWPDFPDLNEIRSQYGKDVEREQF